MSTSHTPGRLVAAAQVSPAASGGLGHFTEQRAVLIAAIVPLARDAGWTAQECGLLRGKWGQRATVEQLQAIHGRLWDATAAEVVEWDDPTCEAVWDVERFVRALPLANCPVRVLTKAEVVARENSVRFGLAPADVVEDMRLIAQADARKLKRQVAKATGIYLTRRGAA